MKDWTGNARNNGVTTNISQFDEQALHRFADDLGKKIIGNDKNINDCGDNKSFIGAIAELIQSVQDLSVRNKAALIDPVELQFFKQVGGSAYRLERLGVDIPAMAARITSHAVQAVRPAVASAKTGPEVGEVLKPVNAALKIYMQQQYDAEKGKLPQEMRPFLDDWNPSKKLVSDFTSEIAKKLRLGAGSHATVRAAIIAPRDNRYTQRSPANPDYTGRD